jgi:hypothetical protein
MEFSHARVLRWVAVLLEVPVRGFSSRIQSIFTMCGESGSLLMELMYLL